MLPAAGTDGLEGLDDVAQAPLHGLEHFYDTVEVVGHADAGVNDDVVAMGRLMGGGALPCLLHRLAKRGEGKGGGVLFVSEIGHEMGEKVLAAAYYEGDEIGAATVVVVTCIARTIG